MAPANVPYSKSDTLLQWSSGVAPAPTQKKATKTKDNDNNNNNETNFVFQK